MYLLLLRQSLSSCRTLQCCRSTFAAGQQLLQINSVTGESSLLQVGSMPALWCDMSTAYKRHPACLAECTWHIKHECTPNLVENHHETASQAQGREPGLSVSQHA